jgi:glutathione S-transferase
LSDLVLYRAPATRSLSALWMLEELGVPYRMETVRMQSPDYVAVNPRGWVPMIVDGETKLTETPAICLYLADRYGYGTLAPKLEEPARGPYMSWTVWATAVLEPASALDGHDIPPKRPGAWHFGFGKLERELEVLRMGLGARDVVAREEEIVRERDALEEEAHRDPAVAGHDRDPDVSPAEPLEECDRVARLLRPVQGGELARHHRRLAPGHEARLRFAEALPDVAHDRERIAIPERRRLDPRLGHDREDGAFHRAEVDVGVHEGPVEVEERAAQHRRSLARASETRCAQSPKGARRGARPACPPPRAPRTLSPRPC